MKPTIAATNQGEITVLDESINYDFYINAEGDIIRRTVKSNTDGESSLHTLTLTEAGEIYDPNVNEMIIGYIVNDKISLSFEATDFFEAKRCKIKILPLNEAITYWNRYEGHAIGLFHITQT